MGGCLSKPAIKYVKRYRDAGLVWRLYFRRKGFAGGPLPGPIGSLEFLEAYRGYMESGKPEVAGKQPGTFGKLVTDFYSWAIFLNLKPTSKATYRHVLEGLVKKHGHRPVSTMPRDKVIKIIEEIGANSPAMANLTVAILRRMFTAAHKRGMLNPNPFAENLDQYKIGTYHTWTDEELSAFEVRWPLGSRERLAYALLLYTGQRGGDVVRMNRGDITANGIRVVQEKTGAELTLPIHPDLAAAITALPAKGLSLLGNERSGEPIQRAMLTRLMRDAIREAGLPGRCVAHGLRKAALRTMAEHGASAKQLAAVSGHKTTEELDRYTSAGDQALLARSGIAMMPTRK
jgi:integrase